MKIENKILLALSFSAISLCTYQGQAFADDTDVEILNFVEDQRKEQRQAAKDEEINKFKKDLTAI